MPKLIFVAELGTLRHFIGWMKSQSSQPKTGGLQEARESALLNHRFAKSDLGSVEHKLRCLAWQG
jgi:hypothetical protein